MDSKTETSTQSAELQHVSKARKRCDIKGIEAQVNARAAGARLPILFISKQQDAYVSWERVLSIKRISHGTRACLLTTISSDKRLRVPEAHNPIDINT